MHIEEYGLLEKKGVQLGVGTTKNGLGVLLYASLDDSNVFVVSSEKYKVVSTIAKTYSGFTPSAIDEIALFNFFSGILGAINTFSPTIDTFSFI